MRKSLAIAALAVLGIWATAHGAETCGTEVHGTGTHGTVVYSGTEGHETGKTGIQQKIEALAGEETFG